jgi:hypothetical protein
MKKDINDECSCVEGIDENGFHCNQCDYFEDLQNTDYELFDKDVELEVLRDYDFVIDDDMF